MTEVVTPSSDIEFQKAGQMTSALSTLLGRVRTATGAPGIAAGISAKGRRMEAFSGFADLRKKSELGPVSRFGIACVTKLLTAILVQKLEAKGILSIDDPADRWLAPLGLELGYGGRIKISHLLSHTSGLQGPMLFGVPHRQFTIDRLAREIGTYSQIFPPGSTFNYENIGHVLVSEIVSSIFNLSPTELFSREIFEPLGIVPGNSVRDFKEILAYVAPHRLVDGGGAQVVAPAPFGSLWAGSLSDLTLNITDLLKIGEAIVLPGAYLNHLLPTLRQRSINVPETVSGRAREHLPHFFNLLCAEYSEGWFGYAGSPPGQTIGFRFNPNSHIVTAVAINAWLPIARDTLLDRISGSVTHPDSGNRGGVVDVRVEELPGFYHGGGNIIRMAEVSMGQRSIKIRLGPEGLTSPEFSFGISEEGDLVPDPAGRNPALGFFRSRDDGRVCMFVGSAALKRVAN